MDDDIIDAATAAATSAAATADAQVDEQDLKELEKVFDRVKTHFPPAKIKKIMQADEDIGKVAQATPVIAGRSLELFLSLLVKRSCDTASKAGTHRISGDIMKQTILANEQFDFLRENVCGETPSAQHSPSLEQEE